MDHTGMFWIHHLTTLGMSGGKNHEGMHNMLMNGWASIPTAWKEESEIKKMEKLDEEYNNPRRETEVNKIHSDMVQLMSDCALRNNMIRGDQTTVG
jgi:hypothetical protein